MIDHPPDRETQAAGPTAEGLAKVAPGYAASVRQRIAEESGRLKDYVAREPVRALGLALGVGVLIGWYVKRR
jgi:ElaB/YqjD/DUF883 family membrane-anchored ribosome-binding protein